MIVKMPILMCYVEQSCPYKWIDDKKQGAWKKYSGYSGGGC